MSLGDETWNYKMDIHLTEYPFSLRLFQTHFTILLHTITGLSLKVSFYTIQYVLALITGLLFFKYLRSLGFEHYWPHLGMILFFTSLSVMGAHFAPIHTWDDFWLYMFLLLTAMSILSSSWYQAALFFTLGCFARETFLLFYPILLLFAWQEMKFKQLAKLCVCTLAPLLVYGTYLMFFGERPANSRWGLLFYNFENSARSADSAVSIVNAFGFVWLLAIAGVVKLSRISRTASQEFCFWGVILLLPINMIMVASFAMIRETRLLFVPFLFVIPIALWQWKAMWESMKIRRQNILINFAIIAITVLLVIAGVYLSEIIWPVFDYRITSELRRTFAGINIGLTVSVFLFWVLSKTGSSKQFSERT